MTKYAGLVLLLLPILTISCGPQQNSAQMSDAEGNPILNIIPHPEQMTIERGTKGALLNVRLEYHRDQKPVLFKFEGLPNGVTIGTDHGSLEFEPNTSNAPFKVNVAETTETGTSKIKIIVTMGEYTSNKASVELTIEKSRKEKEQQRTDYLKEWQTKLDAVRKDEAELSSLVTKMPPKERLKLIEAQKKHIELLEKAENAVTALKNVPVDVWKDNREPLEKAIKAYSDAITGELKTVKEKLEGKKPADKKPGKKPMP